MKYDHPAKPSLHDLQSGTWRGTCVTCGGRILEVSLGTWVDDWDGHNPETYWRHAPTKK